MAKRKSSSKKSKKKKGPEKPKRPKSAYLFFCDDFRENVKKELGEDTKPSRIMQELGSRWQNLPDKKKAHYHQMAQQAKERYNREMEDYQKNKSESESDSSSDSSSDDNKKKKKKRKKKDPNAPKRPLTSYMIFCQDVRPQIKEEHPDWSTTQITKEIGSRWRNMDEGARQPYKDKAVQQKEDYDKRMAEYKKRKSEEEEESDSE